MANFDYEGKKEVFNELKQLLPDIVIGHKGCIETVQGIINNRNSYVEMLDNNFGQMPEVARLVKMSRETAEIDEGVISQLQQEARLLEVLEDFFTNGTME